MRRNPRGDWTIDDVAKLCALHDIELEPPSGGGSHFKAISLYLAGHQTIVARKPIKPVYISALVSMIDAHEVARKKGR
ncbi:hypothetical protein C3941_19615 [Kaistia algarum]|nr:hypothetical protein C3941_19615 [Kaistia algarum]